MKSVNIYKSWTICEQWQCLTKEDLPVESGGKLGYIIEVEESEPWVRGKKKCNDVAVAVPFGSWLSKSATCIVWPDLWVRVSRYWSLIGLHWGGDGGWCSNNNIAFCASEEEVMRWGWWIFDRTYRYRYHHPAQFHADVSRCWTYKNYCGIG